MKRSQTVVAVIAATTIGGAAYSIMPRETCVRADGGAAIDPAATACRGGGGRSGGSGSGFYHGGGQSLFGSPSSGAPSTSAGTTRGGFGGFMSSLGAHIGA